MARVGKIQKSIGMFSALAIMALHACNPNNTLKNETDNPLVEEFDTPYQVPPFDKIQNRHFKPAIELGIRQQQEEIEIILQSPEAPTFENSIEALEKSGTLLGRVNRIFNNLNSANTNDSIQQIAKEIAPEISKNNDNIYLNEKLFERIQEVYNQREELDLGEEQLVLLDKTYRKFVRGGANLSKSDQEKLREINGKLSLLSLSFGQNVLSETNNYQLVIEDKSQLSGLPEGIIASAEDDAKAAGLDGKWLFTLQNPSLMPFLQYADNRELRKEIWEAYRIRGNQGNENDNKLIVLELANLRREKAQLLGYESHADYVLEETMAKNPERVYQLLRQLWDPAIAMAREEAKDIQNKITSSGLDHSLEPYDWRYYAEKIRQERFDLDEQEIKPYFSLDKVREGIFMVTEKLYGLRFELLEDVPVYHPEVTAYAVMEADGSHIGVLYMDFHPRKSKRGGAWMTSYQPQRTENGKRIPPVISIVCNFSKPTTNTPALLTFEEVTTFFHEFGHALHGLLSNVTYQSLAGTSVPRDFVELPSQIMENWAEDPAVMKSYAVHYQTGEVIPDELIAKLQKSGTFNQGFATTEYLAASFLDLSYHTQKENIAEDINEFESNEMEELGLTDEILPRYRSTYFNHVFSGGYSSGYYSYIWSGVLDTDAFSSFQETDLFDPEKAASFRKNILERGGTGDPMELYVKFRGSEPKIDALLKKRGLEKAAIDRTK